MQYTIPLSEPGSTYDQPTNPTVLESNNYLASNFYQFQLNRVSNVTYFCQAVSFPGTQLSPVEMPNTLGRPNQFVGGRFTHEPLTVQFLVDEDMLNYREIFDWITRIGNYADDDKILAGFQANTFFSDATLLITNSAYRHKIRVKFKDTYPIALSGLNFSSQLGDNEPLAATVSLNFETLEIENL